ncbi:MAG TPA: hypothetical protein P5023_07265 [Bacteroidales bacterium]|nr:hypothetical protein [Bacteroidales bacterium]
MRIEEAKNTLIGSSPSLDGVKNLISKYWYGSTIYLDQIDEDMWSVSNAKGLRPNFAVIYKKGRYSFVQLPEPLKFEETYRRITEKSGIKLIDGYHLTATEKKHILYILENGLVEDFLDEPRIINKVKSYQFFPVDENVWKVKIGSKYETTYGRGVTWNDDTVVIEYFG